MIIAQSKISNWTHAFEAINIRHFSKSFISTILFSVTATIYPSLDNTMNAYVGIEGYTTKSGFIHKELCIYYDGEEFDHYLFKRPGWDLTEKDMKTVRYASSQLNGLHFNDGDIPYEEFGLIPKAIAGYQIYTFSDLAVNTLRKYLPKTWKIKNIQDLGYEMPKHLPNSHCFRSHRSRYCAKSKALEVRDFMKCFE